MTLGKKALLLLPISLFLLGLVSVVEAQDEIKSQPTNWTCTIVNVTQLDANPVINVPTTFYEIRFNTTINCVNSSSVAPSSGFIVYEFPDMEINETVEAISVTNSTGDSQTVNDVSDTDTDGYYEVNFTASVLTTGVDNYFYVVYKLFVNVTDNVTTTQITPAYIDVPVDWYRTVAIVPGNRLNVTNVNITIPVHSDASNAEVTITPSQKISSGLSGENILVNIDQINGTDYVSGGYLLNATWQTPAPQLSCNPSHGTQNTNQVNSSIKIGEQPYFTSILGVYNPANESYSDINVTEENITYCIAPNFTSKNTTTYLISSLASSSWDNRTILFSMPAPTATYSNWSLTKGFKQNITFSFPYSDEVLLKNVTGWTTMQTGLSTRYLYLKDSSGKWRSITPTSNCPAYTSFVIDSLTWKTCYNTSDEQFYIIIPEFSTYDLIAGSGPGITIYSPRGSYPTRYPKITLVINVSTTETANCTYSTDGISYHPLFNLSTSGSKREELYSWATYTLRVKCWDIYGGESIETSTFSIPCNLPSSATQEFNITLPTFATYIFEIKDKVNNLYKITFIYGNWTKKITLEPDTCSSFRVYTIKVTPRYDVTQSKAGGASSTIQSPNLTESLEEKEGSGVLKVETRSSEQEFQGREAVDFSSSLGVVQLFLSLLALLALIYGSKGKH